MQVRYYVMQNVFVIKSNLLKYLKNHWNRLKSKRKCKYKKRVCIDLDTIKKLYTTMIDKK